MKSQENSTDNLRGMVQVTFFLCVCLWHTLAAIVGLFIFLLMVRVLKINWKISAGAGVLMAIVGLPLTWVSGYHSIHDFFVIGWQENIVFWKMLARGYGYKALSAVDVTYPLIVPWPMAGILAIMELIPNSAHERQLRALQRGNAGSYTSQKHSTSLAKTLERVSDTEYDGTLLGVSASSGKAVVMPDANVNQLALVLGTTGGGKTVTLRRFYQRAILANYPLIIIDGKPTAESTAWIAAKAKAAGKPFYGFNCENYWHYDPLAHGGHTELKDKIISLKDEWENDYYRSVAEDYLQTTFEILKASGKPYNMKRVVECLDFSELALLVRSIKNPSLEARAKLIAQYDGQPPKLGPVLELVISMFGSMKEAVAALH